MATETAYLTPGTTEEQIREGAGQNPPKQQLLLNKQGPCTKLQISQPFSPFLLPPGFYSLSAPQKMFYPSSQIPKQWLLQGVETLTREEVSATATFLNCLFQMNSLWYIEGKFSSLVFRTDVGILHTISKEGIWVFRVALMILDLSLPCFLLALKCRQ